MDREKFISAEVEMGELSGESLRVSVQMMSKWQRWGMREEEEGEGEDERKGRLTC